MTDSTRWKKRCFDLVVGVPLALVSLPAILILAIASAISFNANPFFVQRRVGRNGGIFRFVKVRSLPADAPSEADKYQITGVRNTKVGRFLRRFHLDETPQIWLVVTGRMSLVGPRPEMVGLSSTFDPTFVAQRATFPPGCTGLWQISTATAGLINESPEFDEHYVRNWTLRLDIWILARTFVTILCRSSIKDIGQVPTWTGAALLEPAEALA